MGKKKESIDHLGQKFPSQKEMAEYWRVNSKTLSARIKKWGLEKALTKPVDNIYNTRTENSKEERKEILEKKYVGKIFNNIEVLEIGEPDKSHHRKAKFRCFCGKEFVDSLYKVTGGERTSCGCLKLKNLEKCIKVNKSFCIDNTNVLSLNKKLNKNNTSGVKGVYKKKNGKYVAFIGFKMNKYHLGTYDTLEDAALARAEAEKEIYGNFLEWYAKEFPEQWEKIEKRREKDE